MNKQILIFASICIVVVLTVIAAFYAWFTSESDPVTPTATVVVAGATLLLALATFRLASVALDEIRETRAEHRETERASMRPLLTPSGTVWPVDTSDWWTEVQCPVSIQNVGPGLATNIRGVIFPASNNIDPRKQYSLQAAQHIAANSTVDWRQIGMFSWGGTWLTIHDRIDGNVDRQKQSFELGAPYIEPIRPNSPDTRDRYFLRLTLTYSDVFGSKFASIFDLTTFNSWICRAILTDVSQDLGDLDLVLGQAVEKAQAQAPGDPYDRGNI